MGVFDGRFVLATIHRKPFACTACGGGRFEHRRYKPNTGIAEFFDLAWANRTADCLVCEVCGYLHWFLDPDPVMEMWDPEGGYPAD